MEAAGGGAPFLTAAGAGNRPIFVPVYPWLRGREYERSSSLAVVAFIAVIPSSWETGSPTVFSDLYLIGRFLVVDHGPGATATEQAQRASRVQKVLGVVHRAVLDRIRRPPAGDDRIGDLHPLPGKKRPSTVPATTDRPHHNALALARPKARHRGKVGCSRSSPESS